MVKGDQLSFDFGEEGKSTECDLEKKRADALARGVASTYSSLCDELGVEPEDPLLYEHGAADIDYVEDKLLRLDEEEEGFYGERDALLERFSEYFEKGIFYFIEEGEKLSRGNVSADVDNKRRLLDCYFSRRFGLCGSQSITRREYIPAQIGTIFKKVFDYYAGEIRKIFDFPGIFRKH